ncbi:MAG: ABC transporter permease [Cyanobacteria bacterium J06641_5]
MLQQYWRVLGLFWQSAIAAELEYRLNFVLASISAALNLVGSLFGIFLFYRTGYQFQDWRWEEALVVLAVFTLLQGISTTFLIPNLNRIVEQVQQGTLDFVLLKPISSQFWLSLRAISPWGLPDVMLGLGLIVYAGDRLGLPAWAYGGGFLTVVTGVSILYSLWFILGATSIWFVKIYNVTEVLRGLLDAGRFPLTAYPAAFRAFFTFVVPVAFLTTVPAKVFLGQSEALWLMGSVGLAIALPITSALFWRFALRFYTSASS